MSLHIVRNAKNIKIKYDDGNHQGEIIISLRDESIVILNQRNLRIIAEVIHEGKHLRIGKKGVSMEADVVKIKEGVKTEIVRLLKDHNALSRDRALTLDEIIEIAQYEKESYPHINVFINLFDSVSKAKKILALMVASLRKSGYIESIAVNMGRKRITKFYLLKQGE